MKKTILITLIYLSHVQFLNAQNWHTIGNNANPSDWLGTINKEKLIVKTFNSTRLVIDTKGDFLFNVPSSYISSSLYSKPVYNFSGSTSDIGAGNSEIFTLTHYTQSLTGGQLNPYNIFNVQNISNIPPYPASSFFNILNTGNVGINIKIPQEKLHVNNGIIRVSGQNHAGGPMIEFGGTPTTQSADWAIEYGVSTSTPSLHGLNFWKPWGSINPGNYYLFLSDNGNVGIGTDNPGTQFKLAVEGIIGAREIQVTTQPWPDYVFEAGYKRSNLNEIENYIKENKHLPGINSAKEVRENGGIKLGDMQLKQMEKIEELYLFMIELNKENEKLRERISELEKSVR